MIIMSYVLIPKVMTLFAYLATTKWFLNSFFLLILHLFCLPTDRTTIRHTDKKKILDRTRKWVKKWLFDQKHEYSSYYEELAYVEGLNRDMLDY